MKTKVMKLLGVMLTVSTLFTGCGTNGDRWGGADGGTGKVYTLKEALERKGPQIWYYVSVERDDVGGIIFGKDNCIDCVFVWENGKGHCCTRYDDTYDAMYYLGDVAKLDDSEIIATLKESCKTSDKPFEINIITDPTGNDTYGEELYYWNEDEGENLELDITFHSDWRSITLAYPCEPITVYDKQYAGYYVGESNGELKGAFITRVDGNESFSLDTPTTDGVFVDASQDEIDEALEELLQ